MNLDEIKRILQMMEENSLVEFELEEEGRKLKLRRAEERPAPAPVSIAVPAAVPIAAPAAVPAPEAEKPSNLLEFKSPLVGTFYRSSKPDSDPFVNVGDEVNSEKILCIIEAMKVMNEIKAEMNGVVREVLVKNGQAVEFGEILFLIEKK
jgi:acetyl-CoA carboxylase biotin carboxyl carrier protein